MEEIAKDFYYVAIRPVAPFAAVVLVIWLSIHLIGEEIADLARAAIEEITEMLQLKPSLKALDGFGLFLAFLLVLAAGVGGLPVLPEGSDADSAGLSIRDGANIIYFAIFVVGWMLCLVLTKSERR